MRRWGPVAAAVVTCLACYALGWRGTDWAAQIYRANQDAHFGFVIWDPGWYGGTFFPSYSVLFPLMAGYLGLWPVALGSAGAASLCFDRLLPREPGYPRLVSCYFAASTVIEVAIGQLPTLAGEAFALGCVLCMRPATGTAHAGRLARGLAAYALAAAAVACTPLAGAFLALSLAAWGLAEVAQPTPGRAGQEKLVMAAAVLLATLALPIAFGVPGYFPFPGGDLAVVLGLCAFCAGPWAALPVRAAAVLYALGSVVLFVVPNQVGDNDARLGASLGVPMAFYYMPGAYRRARTVLFKSRPRYLHALASIGAASAAGGLVMWHWYPIGEALGGASNGHSSTASFFRPMLRELTELTRQAVVRLEVVPLAHHWESAYVAASFPLARGWERQLDLAYNPLFYGSKPLSPAEYRSWLMANGVSYVALADAPLDFAGVGEAALLRSRPIPGLTLVWHTTSWDLWKVKGSPSLAGGPASVTSLRPGRAVIRFSTAGSAVVRVRWSRYWSVPPSAGNWACAYEAPGDWVGLRADHAGALTLTIGLLAPNHGSCSGGSLSVPAPPVAPSTRIPSK